MRWFSMIDEICSVCDPIQLKSMYMVDVEDATMDVFRKIGYTPSDNIKKSIDRTWVNSSRDDYLSDFIYNVYRRDTGEL